MKVKVAIPVITSIILALVLMLPGCTQAPAPQTTVPTVSKQASVTTVTVTPTAPTTTTIEVEKKFNVLDPTGIFIPVQTKPLANRPNTLDGTIVYIVQGEADPVIMPALNDYLQKNRPKTTWVYYNPQSSFGISTPDDKIKAEAKASIRGIGW